MRPRPTTEAEQQLAAGEHAEPPVASDEAADGDEEREQVRPGELAEEAQAELHVVCAELSDFSLPVGLAAAASADKQEARAHNPNGIESGLWLEIDAFDAIEADADVDLDAQSAVGCELPKDELDVDADADENDELDGDTDSPLVVAANGPQTAHAQLAAAAADDEAESHE